MIETITESQHELHPETRTSFSVFIVVEGTCLGLLSLRGRLSFASSNDYYGEMSSVLR
jgi:hypothetical protein